MGLEYEFGVERVRDLAIIRQYSVVAWINLLYYLTCPNTDLLGIIPSRLGCKINFLGGLPVYFFFKQTRLPSKSEKLYLFYLAHRIQQPISKSWIFTSNFYESKWQQTIGKQNKQIVVIGQKWIPICIIHVVSKILFEEYFKSCF